MNKEIAVLLGFGQKTCSFHDHGKLVVFGRQGGIWRVNRTMSCMPPAGLSIAELREWMGKVLQFLGDCKIVAGLSVSGIPYYELDKANCCIWEVEGQPDQFLDDMWYSEARQRALAEQNAVHC